MDFALPDDFSLGPSRGHTYRRLHGVDDLGPLTAKFAELAVWNVACKFARAPDAAMLTEAIEGERSLAVWAMEAKSGGARAAWCVVSTYALDWHVAVVHEAKFSLTRHVEGVGHLADAVFNAQSEVQEVWTALTLPEPADAGEVLAALGFTEVPSSLDLARRRTYGLFRNVWEAYQAG